jgi:NAD(P)-dependent dehydrogenase (short-subunit alcohol dehydrogenase family)
MAHQRRLAGKTTLVTGGALGIGRSACTLMASEGAHVVVTDLLDEAGEQLVREIRSSGDSATFKRLDVADESQVRKVIGETVADLGRLDVLVNNAGVAGVNKPTHEITEEEWDALMAVNVKGVFFCTKHAVPHMKACGGGSIINISSIYGIIGAADLPPYHASKGAVRLMTKNDALLYAPDNIRVNSVHPGYIWTPLVEKLAEQSPEGKEAFRTKLDARHPLGSVGEPDDIGWGIVYLASDESKFMTGAELVIDGGYTAQ